MKKVSVISDMRKYWRFAVGPWGYIRKPITLEQSREIIKRRLRERERNFLAILKRAVYENEKSPYIQLLKLAGCEYGDIEQMVRSIGIESALNRLREEGVYISYEEFKGKKEVIRGERVFQFKESEFDNPFLSCEIESQTGASRSAGTRIFLDFDTLRYQWAVYYPPMLDANDVLGLTSAVWTSIVPGVASITVLEFIAIGAPFTKCFSRLGQMDIRPPFKSRMAMAYLEYVGRILGAKWPKPEYVAPEDAWRVAQWIAQTVKERGGCWLLTFPNSAVRICQAARKEGLDIRGAKFCLVGEPFTQAKRNEVESSGATAFTNYAFMEAGMVGGGCPRPVAPDDVHLFKDAFAVIQHQRRVPHSEVSVNAFLFTSLSPSTSKVLLNVESGDYGMIESRHCGCKLEELGFTDHIYNIRGFDKLTGEGVTLVGTELVNIIEQILPAKFGGASTDYQLLEEEDKEAHTRLSIVVNPEVGVIDEEELIATVLRELGKGSFFRRADAELWFQAKTLRVKRIPPFTTARGKLLPLQIQKGKQAG